MLLLLFLGLSAIVSLIVGFIDLCHKVGNIDLSSTAIFPANHLEPCANNTLQTHLLEDEEDDITPIQLHCMLRIQSLMQTELRDIMISLVQFTLSLLGLIGLTLVGVEYFEAATSNSKPKFAACMVLSALLMVALNYLKSWGCVRIVSRGARVMYSGVESLSQLMYASEMMFTTVACLAACGLVTFIPFYPVPVCLGIAIVGSLFESLLPGHPYLVEKMLKRAFEDHDPRELGAVSLSLGLIVRDTCRPLCASIMSVAMSVYAVTMLRGNSLHTSPLLPVLAVFCFQVALKLTHSPTRHIVVSVVLYVLCVQACHMYILQSLMKPLLDSLLLGLLFCSCGLMSKIELSSSRARGLCDVAIVLLLSTVASILSILSPFNSNEGVSSKNGLSGQAFLARAAHDLLVANAGALPLIIFYASASSLLQLCWDLSQFAAFSRKACNSCYELSRTLYAPLQMSETLIRLNSKLSVLALISSFLIRNRYPESLELSTYNILSLLLGLSIPGLLVQYFVGAHDQRRRGFSGSTSNSPRSKDTEPGDCGTETVRVHEERTNRFAAPLILSLMPCLFCYLWLDLPKRESLLLGVATGYSLNTSQSIHTQLVVVLLTTII